ncbi:MAG: Hsp20/alpha crystallin family protein [Chloroflexota bacterium]|nr:Hsp20/alpha crystallin family protein [Chloroflexota bacterium]
MSLTRWQPLREMGTLRDAMDRLFDETFFQPLSTFSTQATLPVDIIERDNELLVRAVAPGFKPEDIDISVQGDRLTLRGSLQEEHQDENGNYHLREYRVQNFQRSVRLPVSVNAEQAQAEHKNGILTIHLPKAEEAATKRITVEQQ